MAERKIPLRKCIGCGEMKDKRELVRIVRNKEDAACLDKAQKAKRLERAFSSKIEPEIYDTMRRELVE